MVDLVTGKCKPGKVSRTVSRTPLTLDLTVVCTSSAVVPPPGVFSDHVLPPATVASEGIDIGSSGPVVAAPAPVVEHRGVHVVELPRPQLPESPELLPLSGRSSSSPSPTLLWGAADDSSLPFSPNHVQARHSQDVADKGSLFHASPLSPGLLFRPSRGVSRLRLRGSHCRRRWTTSMIRFWVIRSHMRCVNSFRGQNPHCLCMCMRGRPVRPSCWILQYFILCWPRGPPLCRRRGPRPLLLLWIWGRPVIRDRTAGLSVPILGVRKPAVYRWESSVWITASSSSVSGVRRSTGVGPAPRLFADVLGGSAGQGTSNGNGHKPTAGCGRHVVKSSDTVAVTQNVVLDDGLGHWTVVVSESRGRRLSASAVSSSGGIVYVGHGPVAPSDGSG